MGGGRGAITVRFAAMPTPDDPLSNAATLAAAAGDETAETMVGGTAATRAGDVAATLGGTAETMMADGAASPSGEPAHEAAGVRYEAGELLGRGGMGDVRLCLDARLGRSVAFKTMRTHASDSLRARFLREARLQARLEHPSIVPVYDLDTGPDGSPFFTMRRLGGHTLEQVIQGLRAGRPEYVARHRRGHLLADFVRVCQAIAYAHSRGVIHRDLKPSNVIVAEFGEVYVLDWGIAKVLGEPEPVEPAEPPEPFDPAALAATAADTAEGELLETLGAIPSQHAARIDRTELEATAHGTADGAVLGTLGYMPPEQLEGGASRVDRRADVYALGAMLFELLTLEPLHPRTSVAELIESTLSGVDARASVRAPEREIPPELEAICVRACAQDPAARYDDVRELVAALERYVDGDRDEQRRRALADEHASLAQRELQHAASDVQARSRAAREAGRALAFDPEHREALAVLTRLLLEPPKEVPPEVARQLHEADVESSRSMARFGGYARILWLGFLGMFLWMGVRSWVVYGALVAMLLLAILYSLAYGADSAAGRNRRMRVGGSVPLTLVVLNAAMLTLLATAMGPFIIVPGIAAVSTAMYLLGGTRNAPLVVALGCAPILVPFLAEQLGAMPMIDDPRVDTFVLHPVLASFPPLPTTVVLVTMALATVFMAGLSVVGARRRLVASREQQLLLAWHLGQIVPGAKPTA
jgi:serine/threonine protein kinase